MRRKHNDRLAAIETALAAVVEASEASAAEHARCQTEVLAAVGKLSGKIADLAETVREVMAARAQHDREVAADAKAARSSSEAAFAGVQALAAIATAKPEPAPEPAAAPGRPAPKRP